MGKIQSRDLFLIAIEAFEKLPEPSFFAPG
jgi:hypothetical protein